MKTFVEKKQAGLSVIAYHQLSQLRKSASLRLQPGCPIGLHCELRPMGQSSHSCRLPQPGQQMIRDTICTYVEGHLIIIIIITIIIIIIVIIQGHL